MNEQAPQSGKLTLRDHKFDELWYKETPNNSGKFRSPPKYLVMHYTAGTSPTGARDWLLNKQAKASAHLIVGEAPEQTWQICPFDEIAWHAGKSFYQGISGLNSYSIGIEVVNAGILTQGVDRKWRTYTGQVVPEERVVVSAHQRGGPFRGWMTYSPQQLEWLEILTIAILNNYPSIKEIVGHDDIAWPRKTDPGPAFPMTRFQNLLEHRGQDESTLREESNLFEVNTAGSALMLRGGPGTNFGIEAKLPNGTKLVVLDPRADQWAFVEVAGPDSSDKGKRGFVFDSYIKRV